ncbi:MAG: RNA-binding S4 domain-containing protein [Saprospiraceae bacterium]|nr:RNA-binding S4 domain-containing protein [Saprospiraceae bacterium]
MPSGESVRIDKWLWSIRIFKSRTLATDTCKSAKVKINEKVAKPSSLVFVGDKISVKKNGFDLQFIVNKIITTRVSAVLAQPCYDDVTPLEELNKYSDWYIGKTLGEIRDRGTGRPTKKDRREIESFKGDFFSYDEFDAEE